MQQDEINEHYHKLKSLLFQEKEEDYLFHKKLLATLTTKQKQEIGYLWLPVQVVGSGFTIGGRVYINVEKKSSHYTNNQLQPGRPVVFYSNDGSNERAELKATVYSSGKNTLRLFANSRDIPDWINNHPLAVEIDFDERTYKLMEAALDQVINSKNERINHFKKIFQGKTLPEFTSQTWTTKNQFLNQSQHEALEYVLNCKDVGILYGPPGTGKTTTLIQIIKNTLLNEKQVLVTASSNVAVDVIVERLVAEGIRTVRIGNISRIDETLIQHTLDGLVESHNEFSNIKKIKIEAAAIRKESSKYKKHFSASLRQERAKMKQEARDLEKWAKELENRITSEIIDRSQVIATTLTSSNNEELQGREFTTVFLDEASQALEPACWIAFSKAQRIIMIGDPLQLPPTVKSMNAKKQGFGISLLEQCLELGIQSKMLNIQYRMKDEIMAFSNEYFYGNKLITADTISKLESNQFIKPLIFIDTAGTGFEEKIVEDLNKEMYQSRYNEGEFFIIREHILKLQKVDKNFDSKDIVIITPYRAQVKYIQEQLQEDNILANMLIRVSSIDGYQGQECDIVFISLVRSNIKNEIGFLTDYRRMNVAMTRAKDQLIIIGDSTTLCNDIFYQKLLDHVTLNEQYHSAYEYMY
jgi:superfamily I DNA and/or RNA helicase